MLKEDPLTPDAPIVRIGTAGWSIDAKYINEFPLGGTHLERYARRLNGVEINSSFHRPHRYGTYERWARATPETFRFSVKLPKAITHERGLISCDEILKRFLDQASGLGDKLEVLLVQLPPKCVFESAIFERFIDLVRHESQAMIALEPRHASWFTADVDARLSQRYVGRVAADPSMNFRGGETGGWNGLAYYRWHGAPRVYYSAYESEQLAAVAGQVVADTNAGKTSWVVFDNTAAGAATGNALALASQVNC